MSTVHTSLLSRLTWGINAFNFFLHQLEEEIETVFPNQKSLYFYKSKSRQGVAFLSKAL